MQSIYYEIEIKVFLRFLVDIRTWSKYWYLKYFFSIFLAKISAWLRCVAITLHFRRQSSSSSGTPSLSPCCRQAEHTVPRIFHCPKHPTTTTPLHMWQDPKRAVVSLKTWLCFESRLPPKRPRPEPPPTP